MPKLYADGFVPIKRVHSKDEDGIIAFPWPEYEGVVDEFMDCIRRDCWIDYDYVPREVEKLIESEEALRRATLRQIRAMLTYVLRGERFCDGWWGHMIEGRLRSPNSRTPRRTRRGTGREGEDAQDGRRTASSQCAFTICANETISSKADGLTI